MNPRVIAALSLAFALLGHLPALAEITRGPYLQDVRVDRVDIVWEGGELTAPMVGYGLLQPTEAFAQALCEGPHCYARPKGLAPDTTYVYQVFDGAEPISSTGSVRTAPSVSKPFRFLLYGDNRSDHDAHAMVMQSIVEDASLIVHTGDLVGSGHFEAHWDIFFAIEADLLQNVPIYPAVGNHEVYGGSADIFERLFHPPSETSGSRLYYAFTWSNARFIIIDGWVNIVGWYDCLVMGKVQNRCLNPEQESWLLDELADTRANDAIDHAFVVVHEGPYSSKFGRTGSAAMRALLPEFAVSKVRMIMSGHDHYYEHGKSGNGLHYVISGGGGAPLYASTMQISDLWPHEILSTMSVHNYQIVEVLGDDVHVISHDVDNNTILDEFWLGAPPACVDVGDCIGEQEGSCSGDWACVDLQCIWECDPGPPCTTAADCPPAPPGICPGHWECPFTEQCTWACTPLDECTADVDCAGKPPLTDCPGGHFACETQFSVCEWRCPAVIAEPDAGGGAQAPDAAEAPAEPDVPVAAEDTGPSPPSPEPPAPRPGDPPPTATPDPVTRTATSATHDTRDGGCAGGGATPGLLALWIAAATLARRRWATRRS